MQVYVYVEQDFWQMLNRTAGVAMSQTVYHDFHTASGTSGSNDSDGAGNGSGIGDITNSAVNIVAYNKNT